MYDYNTWTWQKHDLINTINQIIKSYLLTYKIDVNYLKFNFKKTNLLNKNEI
jgi:hypothetical protein